MVHSILMHFDNDGFAVHAIWDFLTNDIGLALAAESIDSSSLVRSLLSRLCRSLEHSHDVRFPEELLNRFDGLLKWAKRGVVDDLEWLFFVSHFTLSWDNIKTEKKPS